MKTPLVIYHANCADGFAAAWCAWLAMPAETEFLPMQYGDKTDKWVATTFLEDILGREVFMLDFSLPKPVMDDLCRLAKRVVWLDHHKTAFEMWLNKMPLTGFFAQTKNNCTAVLDNSRSGAILAWEYFMPKREVPRLLLHIDDYDRWQFKLDGTREINKAIWARTPWSFQQWAESFESNLEQLEVEGAALQRAHMANIRSVIGGGRMPCEIFEVQTGMDCDDVFRVKGLACNCPAHLSSDAGHELALESGTFGLLWRIGQDPVMALCSLRSNGDYDVSAIARAFGGGGHKNAAGFTVPIATLLSWLH